MISAATSAFLVVRRHVDLGRTRSSMCRPHWPASRPPGDTRRTARTNRPRAPGLPRSQRTPTTWFRPV